jgi:hypothetical protein
VSELVSFVMLFFALLALAAALWVAGAPKIEPREHLRIRQEINGGKLYAVEDWRDAA